MLCKEKFAQKILQNAKKCKSVMKNRGFSKSRFGSAKKFRGILQNIIYKNTFGYAKSLNKKNREADSL